MSPLSAIYCSSQMSCAVFSCGGHNEWGWLSFPIAFIGSSYYFPDPQSTKLANLVVLHYWRCRNYIALVNYNDYASEEPSYNVQYIVKRFLWSIVVRGTSFRAIPQGIEKNQSTHAEGVYPTQYTSYMETARGRMSYKERALRGYRLG